jgi:hypothetical protein
MTREDFVWAMTFALARRAALERMGRVAEKMRAAGVTHEDVPLGVERNAPQARFYDADVAAIEEADAAAEVVRKHQETVDIEDDPFP